MDCENTFPVIYTVQVVTVSFIFFSLCSVGFFLRFSSSTNNPPDYDVTSMGQPPNYNDICRSREHA